MDRVRLIPEGKILALYVFSACRYARGRAYGRTEMSSEVLDHTDRKLRRSFLAHCIKDARSIYMRLIRDGALCP